MVRPFGFPGRNAGYSREAGDLSFGYLQREPASRPDSPCRDGLICTALSHDIIAHETTHALLDGLRSSFMEPTNVDVPAFHEGFSDLVALFLHFSYADVVERAIRESRGAITRGSLLTDIAREFGYARAKAGAAEALRSGVDVGGIAAFDSDILPTKDSGPAAYDPKLESHALGSVLVSAVFEAFTTIVRRKCERFFRIAGIDPNLRRPGGAQRSAGQGDCAGSERRRRPVPRTSASGRSTTVRPADMELGEYLRAMITADGDMERSDKCGFREALMRSFRRRRIFPDHVRVHDRGRGALAVARRGAGDSRSRLQQPAVRG